MATTADPNLRIDLSLKELTAELDFLPELAAGWSARPETSKVSYYLEWDELVSRFDELARSYRERRMDPEQQERYRSLIHKLRALRPLLDQLDLRPPPAL